MLRLSLMTLMAVSACAAPVAGELTEHLLDASGYDQTYTLTVFVPDAYAEGTPIDVIYLFDGDDWTDRTAGIVSRLAADDVVDPAIVVGIGYGDARNQRNRDYTPAAEAIPDGHGEVEAFYGFLEQDLLPWVDGRWSTRAVAEGRTVIGHSFGGIAALWALFAAPDQFGNVVGLSPSLAFGGGVFFDLEEAHAKGAADLPVDVYLGAGSQEAYGLAGLTEAFGATLEARAYPSLRLETEIIGGRFHASLFPPGAERGLTHVLGP